MVENASNFVERAMKLLQSIHPKHVWLPSLHQENEWLPSNVVQSAFSAVNTTFSLPYSARSEAGSGDVEVEAPLLARREGQWAITHFLAWKRREERGEIENFYNCTQ